MPNIPQFVFYDCNFSIFAYGFWSVDRTRKGSVMDIFLLDTLFLAFYRLKINQFIEKIVSREIHNKSSNFVAALH